MSVNTSQLYLITCEEPKKAWDALKKYFERETLANKLFLKKQYLFYCFVGQRLVEVC